MKQKTEKNTYRKGRMSTVINALCEAYKLDTVQVNSFLHLNFPDLFNLAKCSNCEASMMEYIYTVSQLDADLLCTMAQVIHFRVSKGLSFTEANKIHHTEIVSHTLVKRFNISSKLGLIAKVMRKDKKGKSTHDTKSGWLITKRGFDFLSGKPIPKKVKVFRNEIQDRYEDQTTITAIYAGHSQNMVKSISEISGVLLSGFHNQSIFI